MIDPATIGNRIYCFRKCTVSEVRSCASKATQTKIGSLSSHFFLMRREIKIQYGVMIPLATP